MLIYTKSEGLAEGGEGEHTAIDLLQVTDPREPGSRCPTVRLAQRVSHVDG